MQAGIYDHLVGNFTISHSALINGLKSNNLSVAVSDLNKVAEIVEKINKFYNEERIKGIKFTN